MLLGLPVLLVMHDLAVAPTSLATTHARSACSTTKGSAMANFLKQAATGYQHMVSPKAKYMPLSKWGPRPAAAVPSQPTCNPTDCEVTVRSKSILAAGFLEVTPSPTRGHRVRAPVASPDRSARPGSRGAPPRQEMARKIPPRPSVLSPSELERQRRCLHKFDALMRSS